MKYKNLLLHNINEVEEREGKYWLHRFPGDVRNNLESTGQVSADHSGSEIRFMIRGKVRIKLSSDADSAAVIIYYGDNQFGIRYISQAGTVIELDTIYTPENHAKLPQKARYSPDMVRLVLFRTISLDEISGDYELPGAEASPEKKYLAYGTSITQGKYNLLPDLSYPAIFGNLTGFDVFNYGMSGCCFMEDVVIDFLCRESYDLISLCLSVNMLGKNYPIEVFRQRAGKLLRALRDKNPSSPVFLISIMTHWRDLGMTRETSPRTAADCNEWRAVVEDLSGMTNTHFLDGRKILSPANLTTDFIHPGDYGMIEIAYNLYDAFKRVYLP
ncbi:GDSL-type esterase/lipase family protein [Treponema sp. OttesenSCG-928-L16]|nr:GDSL-type esterase/lipase family protein [Treponema sp. OttesenSCG-928-L16]